MTLLSFDIARREKKRFEKPRKRGGDGPGLGFNACLVEVVTLRDRSGKGADCIVKGDRAAQAERLFKQHLCSDTLLLTDGDFLLCKAARSRNANAHIALTGAKSRGIKGTPYHLQTNNAFHSQLKVWMTRFNGIATKYLANYLGWNRHLVDRIHKKDPETFIRLSFNPLSIHPQLTMT